MIKYSKKVIDNFMHPKNMGEMKGADGVGTVGNPQCGDVMKVFIKVDKDKKVIKDVKFKTFGCAAAISTSSMMTQLAKGRTLDKAKKLSNKEIAEALDGLPSVKMHCSNLASEALRKAIEDYQGR